MKVEVSVSAVVDQIMVDEFGNVHVRTVTRYMDGGEVVSQKYHRHVLEPGADLSSQDDKVKRAATAMWTPDVIAAAQKRKAEALAETSTGER